MTADPGFRIVATMNPGGDFGKRELSPALSNRFTQAWIPAVQDKAELLAILESRLAGAANARASSAIPDAIFRGMHIGNK